MLETTGGVSKLTNISVNPGITICNTNTKSTITDNFKARYLNFMVINYKKEYLNTNVYTRSIHKKGYNLLEKMRDIFEAKILCDNCDVKMLSTTIEKSGFRLRAVQCPNCNEKIIHPEDLNNFNHYSDLKRKVYKVKLRVVGNSHTVSIPKEIVDFIHESRMMSKKMDEVVKLCFEDFGRLSLIFNEESKKWH